MIYGKKPEVSSIDSGEERKKKAGFPNIRIKQTLFEDGNLCQSEHWQV